MEFHGWANIRVEEDEEPFEGFRQIGVGKHARAIKLVRAAINDVHDEFSCFEVRQCGNGMIVLTAHGLRNHHFEPVIDLFRWVAETLPQSFGLLYVHDDEQPGRENEFRVWRLAKGELTENDDPFLSPVIPTVEEPWDERVDGNE